MSILKKLLEEVRGLAAAYVHYQKLRVQDPVASAIADHLGRTMPVSWLEVYRTVRKYDLSAANANKLAIWAQSHAMRMDIAAPTALHFCSACRECSVDLMELEAEALRELEPCPQASIPAGDSHRHCRHWVTGGECCSCRGIRG